MKLISTVIGILIISLMIVNCTKKESVIIPEYPNAVEDQEVRAEMFGKDFGGVRRVITSDSYDTVFNYYKENLQSYNPDVISHELDDGRQAAFSIMDTEKSSSTVVVQEFLQEGKVAISYMHLNLEL